MRTDSVNVAGKTILVNERKVKDLKAIYNKYKPEILEALKANTAEDGEKFTEKILYETLPEVFPVLNKEDIDEAYPSELEGLVGAFVNVNFTGLKKVISPAFKLMLNGLKRL